VSRGGPGRLPEDSLAADALGQDGPLLAASIQGYLRAQMPVWKAQRPGVETLKVAVMGCVVNGPGESKHADIGISLPGTFEEPKAPVYVDGRLFTTLRGDGIAEQFQAILNDYVEKRYAGPDSVQ